MDSRAGTTDTTLPVTLQTSVLHETFSVRFARKKMSSTAGETHYRKEVFISSSKSKFGEKRSHFEMKKSRYLLNKVGMITLKHWPRCRVPLCCRRRRTRELWLLGSANDGAGLHSKPSQSSHLILHGFNHGRSPWFVLFLPLPGSLHPEATHSSSRDSFLFSSALELTAAGKMQT